MRAHPHSPRELTLVRQANYPPFATRTQSSPLSSPGKKAAAAATSKSKIQHPANSQQESVTAKVKIPAKKKRFSVTNQSVKTKPHDSPQKSPHPVPEDKAYSVPAEHLEFWQTWTEDLRDDDGIIPADKIRRAIRFFS